MGVHNAVAQPLNEIAIQIEGQTEILDRGKSMTILFGKTRNFGASSMDWGVIPKVIDRSSRPSKPPTRSRLATISSATEGPKPGNGAKAVAKAWLASTNLASSYPAGAMKHAREPIHVLTERCRLQLRVEGVVQDVNRFLRGWAAG